MTTKRVYFILCLLCWVYLWLRAALTSMSHDEIATFYYYVHTGTFLPFSAHWDANNHFLNSALTVLFYKLFGSSPLALRLANVLFAPLYFYYLYKISGEISNRVLRWSFLILLLFTHNFLAFFALSRGYGTSMALLIAGIWHLASAIRIHRMKDSLLAMIFIFLALTANLNLLVTFLIFFLFLLMNFLLNRPGDQKSKDYFYFGLHLFGIIPFILFFIILFIMKDNGNLYGGTEGGFWGGTVFTLIRLLTGSDHPDLAHIVFFFSILIALLYLAIYFAKPSFHFFLDPKNLFILILAGNVAGIIFLSKVLKIHYPEDRMVLYFYPLFIGSLVFVLDRVIEITKEKWAWLMLLPFIFFPVNFIYSLNVTYPIVYKVDNIPQRFYNKVLSSAIPGQIPPTIGGNRMRHFCWSYLDFRNGGKLCQVYWNTYPGHETDFVIADAPDIPGLNQYYESIDYDDISGRSLLKRKSPVSKTLVQQIDTIHSAGSTEKDFFTLFKRGTGDLKGKTIFVGYDLTLFAEKKPFLAWITLAAVDKSGKQLCYSFIGLDWLRTSWNGEQSDFLNGTFLEPIPADADRIESYLWNIDGASYRLTNGKVFIYSIGD